MSQRLLEGDIIENGEQKEVDRLRDLNRTLSRELHDALTENEQLRKRVATSGAPIARLREKLEPFYKLLQALFGDIDELAPESATAGTEAGPVTNSKTAAAWEEWKSRLGGASAKIITALQAHGTADVIQLCILIGTNRKQTVYDAIHKLNKSGLINKNGDRFSLKSLG